MSTRKASISLSVAMFLVACDPSSVHSPPQRAANPVVSAPLASTTSYPCPSDYECTAATLVGQVEPDRDTIAANCPEACGPMSPPGQTALAINFDVLQPGNIDVITISCPNGQVVGWPSSHGCWDCMSGCGGRNCPTGAQCVTERGLSGWDCRAYMCDTSSGWLYDWPGGTFTAPRCRRLLTSSPPATAPVVSASLLDGSPRLRWHAVSGATSYRIYRRLEWQTADDSWSLVSSRLYTDVSTQVSGAPLNSPPSGQWVRYSVRAVNSSGEGPSSAYRYFPYTGVPPY